MRYELIGAGIAYAFILFARLNVVLKQTFSPIIMLRVSARFRKLVTKVYTRKEIVTVFKF